MQDDTIDLLKQRSIRYEFENEEKRQTQVITNNYSKFGNDTEAVSNVKDSDKLTLKGKHVYIGCHLKKK